MCTSGHTHHKHTNYTKYVCKTATTRMAFDYCIEWCAIMNASRISWVSLRETRHREYGTKNARSTRRHSHRVTECLCKTRGKERNRHKRPREVGHARLSERTWSVSLSLLWAIFSLENRTTACATPHGESVHSCVPLQDR